MWLHCLDLEVHEYVGLFNLIDSGAGVVSFPEFLTGVQRLRGQARSVDLIGVVLDVQKIYKTVNQIQKGLQELSGTACVPEPDNPNTDSFAWEKHELRRARKGLIENSRADQWLTEDAPMGS